jgi:hypothetical protein
MNAQRLAASVLMAVFSAAATPAHASIIVNSLSATSNSPGASSGEFVTSMASLTNPDTTTETITIIVSDSDFSALSAPPSLLFETSIAFAVAIGSLDNAVSFISCLATNNQTFAICGPGSIVTAALTPSITAVVSSSAADNLIVPSLLTPYAIGHQVMLTLGPGSEVSFTATSRLEEAPGAVPEPSSVALLMAALLLGGIVLEGRRSRAKL